MYTQNTNTDKNTQQKMYARKYKMNIQTRIHRKSNI